MDDELDCSDGAKMLIERMKTHPDEFRGGSARWAVVMNQTLQVRRGGVESNVFVSKRDMNALFAAFETHVMETSLTEHVIKELMEPKEERKKVQVMTKTQAQLKQDMNDILRRHMEAETRHAEMQLRNTAYNQGHDPYRNQLTGGLKSPFEPFI